MEICIINWCYIVLNRTIIVEQITEYNIYIVTLNRYCCNYCAAIRD